MSVRKDPTVAIAPWEVSIFNILLKVARLANMPAHKDSWIDIAGYAACGYDITVVEYPRSQLSAQIDKWNEEFARRQNRRPE